MFFSKKDEKIMKRLLSLAKENEFEVYRLAFSDDSVIEAKIVSYYETDNALEDEDFEEYNACVMRVVKVIIDKKNKFCIGNLFEVNYHNYPLEIRNSKGEKIA